MNFDLAAFAEECHVKNAPEFAIQCARLREILEEANKITNLTRILGEQDFAIKHAADSLSIGKFFPELAEKTLRIADIGCGAGFPSLILALAYPQLTITSIDSTGKKIAFVADAAKKLGLTNLTAIHGRANELNRKQEFMRKFDIITARAVAEAASIYRDTSKFPAPGGRYILYQSPERAETDSAQLQKARCRITPAFELPESAGFRCFLEIFPGK
ncbi:MAG: 16S rRNA (guanine(527)-N(7))-methyltransferase RsmG [Lentisphaeria bacterium]|nr:16S rRNA (guanine(527)-N(7))-methyltransferase RsmG [Lentisphaeria bacterium]